MIKPFVTFSVVFSYCTLLAQATENLPRVVVPEPPTELIPDAVLGPQLHPIEGASFMASRMSVGKFAETVDGDHELAGFLTNGGGPYTGVMASHNLYAPANITLALPTGATLKQTLYAPTTRAPNGSCLEVGTAYQSYPGESTHVSVYAYDFCKNHFGIQKTVDESFLEKYSSTSNDGSMFYILSIATNAPSPGISANWDASLFNFKTKKWDKLYSTTGLSNDSRGWSLFETWYQKGQCSKSLPIFRSWNIQFKNSGTANWEDVQQNMTHLTVNQYDGKTSDLVNTNCFNDDNTGPASYDFAVLTADSAWEVRSTGH
jgi:hypothetical protein